MLYLFECPVNDRAQSQIWGWFSHGYLPWDSYMLLPGSPWDDLMDGCCREYSGLWKYAPPHTHTLLRIHLMPKPWSFSYQNLHLFMNDSNAKWFWVIENGVCLVFSFASLNRLFWGGWTYHRYLRTTSMLGWLVGFSIFFKKSPYLLFSWWVHSKCLIIVGGLYTSLYTQIPNSWPHSMWENCFDSRCLYIH